MNYLFRTFINIKRNLNYFISYMASDKDKGGNKMKKLLFGAMLFALVIVVPIPTMAAVDIRIRFPLPPPIVFASPPQLIVLPETYVYVAPDYDDVDLFFWSGWWWRFWEGRWYRSRYYNRGWGYYNNVPSFYFDVDPGWRGYYRDRNWYGHRWDYERIPNQRLQQNWSSWEKNRYWERQKTWGVQSYQPRPQPQRQELRQQRQQEYQQRPEVQQHQQQRQQQRQPQVQKPRQQPQEKVQQPQRQEQRPQVQQPRQPQERVQQPQRQEQRPQAEQPQRSQPRQGKPERGEEEKQDRK
jgi:hypothetical protein